MPDAVQTRDWFDDFWEAHKREMPAFLRNDSFKNTARGIVRVLIEAMGKQAQTPEGVRVVIAFARVVTAMKALMGANINPSPEEVADAVERLVQRVKP